LGTSLANATTVLEEEWPSPGQKVVLTSENIRARGAAKIGPWRVGTGLGNETGIGAGSATLRFLKM
jgi:hypothetical protein